MKYGSVCSGIEGASVAWRGLGWEPVFFAEISPFPSRVLAHHYPHVPNIGDFTQPGHHHEVDLLVGGTPCQSFSVAGLRGGLEDARGNLALESLHLVGRLRPRWVLWENVPGVLSIDGGRAFGAFLGGLAELGYGFAYRVLDARFFGVPQRRRRVFVVGCAGGAWDRAAAVLFEPESLRGDPGPRGGARHGGPHRARGGPGQAFLPRHYKTGGRFGGPLQPLPGTLTSGNLGDTTWHTFDAVGVRRFTPREYERLQGFPDDYTAIPGAEDRERYGALGNSFAIPVVRWIGERIAKIDSECYIAVTPDAGAARNDERERQEPMNIKLKTPSGECEAKRCNRPSAATVPGECWDLDGKRVALCERHVQEASQEFSLDEIEGAVIPLTVASVAVARVEDATAALEANTQDELREETAEAKGALEEVKALEIQTQDDLDFAAETLAEVKGRSKRLKERLDLITKPMNEALKSARALFKPAMDYYGEIESELKKRISEHALRQEEANRQAMLAASAAHEAGDSEGTAEALASVTTLGEVSGLSTRQTWDFIVEDVSLLPREFLIPNEKLLGAHARSAKGHAPTPIPGVRFVPKVVVASRSA